MTRDARKQPRTKVLIIDDPVKPAPYAGAAERAEVWRRYCLAKGIKPAATWHADDLTNLAGIGHGIPWAINTEQLSRDAKRASVDLAKVDLLAYRALAPPPDGPFEAGWFHHDLAHHLVAFSDAVIRGERPRLMIMAPPRGGKSFMVEAFVNWHQARVRYVDKIMLTSYALGLARDRARAVRDLLEHEALEDINDGWNLRNDTLDELVFNQGGAIYAAGVGGSLTGKGCRILIIDDPVKDAKEAASAIVRESTWQWYKTTSRTRLAKGGGNGILLIMTRWHEDDLAGRILASPDAHNWTVLSYEAIATEDKTDHRGIVAQEKGESFHEARAPLEVLREDQEAVGPTVWEALYQQRPTTPGGSVWLREWWSYHTKSMDAAAVGAGWSPTPKREDLAHCIVSCDLSFGSTGKAASYNVLQVWGKQGDQVYLMAESRGRWGFPETLRHILSLIATWRPSKVLVEDKANGPAVIDTLRDRLGSHLIMPVKPDGSKVARAYAAAPSIERRRVCLPDPKRAPWVHRWLEEVTSFPAAAHDDRVDAASQALRYLATIRGRTVIGHL